MKNSKVQSTSSVLWLYNRSVDLFVILPWQHQEICRERQLDQSVLADVPATTHPKTYVVTSKGKHDSILHSLWSVIRQKLAIKGAFILFQRLAGLAKQHRQPTELLTDAVDAYKFLLHLCRFCTPKRFLIFSSHEQLLLFLCYKAQRPH